MFTFLYFFSGCSSFSTSFRVSGPTLGLGKPEDLDKAKRMAPESNNISKKIYR
jgi:hypothetical protein